RMRMLPRRPASIFVVAGWLALVCTGAAQERDRARIADKYKWNLADLYPTDAAWRAAKDALAARAGEMAPFKGRLAPSPAVLTDALEKMSALNKEMSRLAVYAHSLADQDTRDSTHQAMKQELEHLSTTFREQTAFIRPEILKADPGTIRRFIAAE